MKYLLLASIIIIWASAIYGFVTDDMGMKFFGRLYAGLAHGAVAFLALGCIGGLTVGTVLAIREIL